MSKEQIMAQATALNKLRDASKKNGSMVTIVDGKITILPTDQRLLEKMGNLGIDMSAFNGTPTKAIEETLTL